MSSSFRTRFTNSITRQPRPYIPPGLPTPTPAPISINVEDAHDQAQSPLFSSIPPEIRNEIFRLALREYVDPEKLYERETYWKRPGVEGLTRLDTSLLRTCKRVWAETKVLPGKDFNAMFYLGHESRAPREYVDFALKHVVYGHPLTENMPPQVWASITHVHVFAQMYALKSGLEHLFSSSSFKFVPSSLTLTLRYTDWWNWEVNQPIYPIRPSQFIDMREIVLPAFITSLTVEFEHIESKIKQLDGVIEDMFKRRDWWVWTRADGKRLVVNGMNAKEEGAVSEWKWEGPTRFKEGSADAMRKYAHHGERDTMNYVVKVVTWEVEKD